MDPVLLGELALSTAVGELYKGIKELIKNYVEFKPVLEEIACTLEVLEPVVLQIEYQNREYVQKKVAENLKKEIEKGQKLVKECSEVGTSLLGCLKKTTRYTDRLRKLDVSLRRQLEILRAQEILVVNKTSNVVFLIAEKLEIDPKDRLPKYRNSLVHDQIKVEDASPPTQMDVPPKVDLANLGTRFCVLYDGVKKLILRTPMKLAALKRIKSTLDGARERIHLIEQNKELWNYPMEEVEGLMMEIEESMVFLSKLSKVQMWYIFKINKFANKLLYLEESLQRLLSILPLPYARDVKEALVLGRKYQITMSMALDMLVSRIETSSTSPAEVNSCAVGLDMKDVLLSIVNCTSDALFAELPNDAVSVPVQLVSGFQLELPNLRTALPHRVQKAAQLQNKKKRLACKTHESYGDKQHNVIVESSHLSRAGMHDMYLAMQSEKRLALLETKYQNAKESWKLERRKLSEEHNSAMAQVATLTRERDSLLAERTGFLEKNERKIRQEAQEEQRNAWVPQFRRQVQDAEKECFRLGYMAGFKSSMANVERKFPNLDLSDISQFEPIEFDVNVIDELLGSDHYDEADNTEGTTDHSDDNNDDGDNNDFNLVSSTSTHEESTGKTAVKVGDLAKQDVNLPISLKSLYHYAEHDMINGTTIIINVEEEVFGVTSTIYILQEDVCQLMEMKPLSATCIIVYIRHLYDVLKKSDLVDRVGFCDPSTISVGVGNSDHKSQVIGTRLLGCINQIVLVPFNCGNHWIFTIISEDRNTCYFMDPLHSLRNLAEWKSIVNNGITQYNSQTAREIQKQPVWKVLKGPKQPSDVECGYYVMRYMKEVIEDENLSFAKKWDSKKTKFGAYTQAELDEVRCEWASHVSKHCGLLMASS